MKKENRIKKSEEFQKIIRKRRTVTNLTFVLYYNKKNEEKARIGISMSKKMGNAVIRNKIKRQLRMMIQETINFNQLEMDAIIIAKAKFKEQSYDVNKKDLERLIKTVKI
ncbi:MAG: ribonuclease P protein component [Erysipelotrichaceae bacterium]